uniref:Uncharacterized protein n=1 Tax=viral metagenome TaxID=1070528 RepID=A0A6M3LN42_9ZZZZ
MKKINHEVKEAAIEALRYHGTMQYAAKVCGVSVRTLNEEMRRSEVFKRRVLEARAEGKSNIADRAIELIKSYAFGENTEKTDRNRLTAAIALANAYEPGFRGTTQVQGRIDHDIRVLSAVPRPKYQIAVEKPKELDKGKGKPYNSVEEVIEGEVINE